MSDPAATVGLIEDDRQNRRYVRVSLESEAMRVFEAETGQAGLAMAASARPDLVIVDSTWHTFATSSNGTRHDPSTL